LYRRETDCENMVLINVSQDKFQQRDFLNMIFKISDPEKLGNFYPALKYQFLKK